MEACSEELASQGIHPLDLKNALVRLHPYSPTSIAQRGIRVGWVGKDHFIPTEQRVGILTPGPSGLQVCWMRVACVCTTCTPPALKHDMSIQTLHSARLPIPCPSFSLFFLDTARGGVRYPGRLTRARGRSSFTWCGPLGDFRWQRCASGAGPDLGPFHPTVAPLSLPPLLLYLSISSIYFMR